MSDDRNSSRYWRTMALLACGVLMGALLAGNPAGAHFQNSIAHLTDHMKDTFFTQGQSNERFLRPSSRLKPLQTLTGVYAAWGDGAGYIGDSITYRIPLAQEIPADKTHFLISGSKGTAECPEPGDAAPGHICVYETSGSNSIYGQIHRSVGGLGSSREGFGLYFDTGQGGAFSYGQWAVTAPAPTAARRTSASIGVTPKP